MLLTILLQADPDQFNDFLLLGYVVLGIIAILYIGYLFNQQRNIKRDLELMEQLLEDDERESS